MALALNRPLNVIRIHAYMADSGSTSAAYMTAPTRGKVTLLGSTLQGTTVGTADNTLTATIAGVAVTTPSWKQLTSGSAAGDIAEVVPTGANTCNAGDLIKISSDGAGTNTTPTMLYADITVT